MSFLLSTPCALFTALAIAFLTTACQPTDDNQAQQRDQRKHLHGDLDIKSFGEDTPVPEISFNIAADTMGGWNVQINTEHFRFAPENVNRDAVAGEGHAHLFVDGYKMARLYGHWFHLKKLTPGNHIVRITLNANDHSTLTYQGQPISAELPITQQ